MNDDLAISSSKEGDDDARISVRVLSGAARWLLDEHGRAVLDRVAETAGIRAEELLAGSDWVAMRDADLFLREVHKLARSDDAFIVACQHKMREGYGPLIHVLPATTPQLLLKMAAKTMPLFSSVSTCEVMREERTRIVFRYASRAPQHESRAMCLSRQAASCAIPTMFGLPPAIVTEASCIAHGDAHCEYEFRFYARSRWVPAALGVIVGVALSYALLRIGWTAPVTMVALPILLGLLGVVYELRATYRANLSHGQGIQDALRTLAEQEAEARREIVQFHQRQKEWAQLMEEQVGERTHQLQRLVEQIEHMGEERVTSVRGVSHDLRNPLAVLRVNAEYVAMSLPTLTGEMREVMQENHRCIDEMDRLLTQLVTSARADAPLVRATPVMMEVAPWVDQIRRRLKALAFGKDVRVSVFKRREAPEEIETDRLIFERIVDNLCSNAAKYTERGSIIVDLDGKPGFLTFKVSDTGRGIEDERIRQIFEPGKTGDDDRAPRSLGVGLSVVVQLLGQLGGNLEVMSKPGQGTTFWAHFPILLAKTSSRAPEAPASHVKLADVVTIRTIHSA